MISLVLLHPNGERQQVLLAGVPRIGDRIRLSNGVMGPSLVVEHVLWMEATDAAEVPGVIVTVRQAAV